MNPTLRGFFVIALIAVVIVVLELETTLTALFLLARIAFFLAIAYLRLPALAGPPRGDLDVVEPLARGLLRCRGRDGRRTWRLALRSGRDRLEPDRFVAVLVLCGFAMWRVWRDEHTYSY